MRCDSFKFPTMRRLAKPLAILVAPVVAVLSCKATEPSASPPRPPGMWLTTEDYRCQIRMPTQGWSMQYTRRPTAGGLRLRYQLILATNPGVQIILDSLPWPRERAVDKWVESLTSGASVPYHPREVRGPRQIRFFGKECTFVAWLADTSAGPVTGFSKAFRIPDRLIAMHVIIPVFAADEEQDAVFNVASTLRVGDEVRRVTDPGAIRIMPNPVPPDDGE